MAGFALHKNRVFDWDGTAYRIDRIQPNGDLLLERISDGHFLVISREQLLVEYGAGKISVKPVDVALLLLR